LTQILTEVYKDPDCPKIPYEDIDVSFKHFIVNIFGNIAEKVEGAA
jgi:hypothetical protein